MPTLRPLLTAACLALACLGPRVGGARWLEPLPRVPGAPPRRAVSWWWSAPRPSASPFGNDTATSAMLAFVKANRAIVTTLIMECGVVTCVKNYTAPRGSPCLNNHGNGGQITGDLFPACKAALPALAALGVRAELWLGEDDSILSARTLFGHAAETAAALVAVARANPGINGFNLDLEAETSTDADVGALVGFLGAATKELNAAPGGPYRFSADVACFDSPGMWDGLTGNCTRLARSGANRLMNMRTCEFGAAPVRLCASLPARLRACAPVHLCACGPHPPTTRALLTAHLAAP